VQGHFYPRQRGSGTFGGVPIFREGEVKGNWRVEEQFSISFCGRRKVSQNFPFSPCGGGRVSQNFPFFPLFEFREGRFSGTFVFGILRGGSLGAFFHFLSLGRKPPEFDVSVRNFWAFYSLSYWGSLDSYGNRGAGLTRECGQRGQ
jgi:hypothetical protein